MADEESQFKKYQAQMALKRQRKTERNKADKKKNRLLPARLTIQRLASQVKVAPYTLVQYLYRSVSNFRRPANVLKYSDHEKLFFEAFLRRNCQVFCS